MKTLLQQLGISSVLHSKSDYSDNSQWLEKFIPLDQAADKVPNGSHVFIGSTAATAIETLTAVVAEGKSLLDINILQFIPGGKLPHMEENLGQFRTTNFFAFGRAAKNIQQGIADYTPISSARMHRLIIEGRIPIDVAIIKTTPPDDEGYLSLGTGVDFSLEAIKMASVVIVEICDHMPWTQGNSLIHANDVSWWTEHNAALLSPEALFPGLEKSMLPADILEKIATNVLFEVPDGATLKFDLNASTNEIVPYFRARKNLGLHTDLLNDHLFKLIKDGVINNSQKNINPGKTLVCHAMGSKALLRYVHRNPDIEFHPSNVINRIDKVARHNNLISIVGGLKVDLSGQVAVDSVGNRVYSGVGSSDDSIRGAGYSEGGKPIVVLPSKSVKGNSNIVFALPHGTGVVITRLDVHYVITEYGTAFLFGKSIRERCLALIDIAHPDYREDLLVQAKNSSYIHEHQPGFSFTSTYPKQWECIHNITNDKSVLVRPIKAIDEDLLRDFFHKLSDHNVYMRYFSPMRSLPQKVLKRFSDIDYSKDMALVALYPPETAQHEIVGIAQWVLDTDDNIPEIAFQIRDDWQGQGLGVFFFKRLVKMAKACKIRLIKADVLADNKAMNKVFEKMGVPFKRTLSFGVFTYVFDLH
ncbi:MAG: acyl-CoA hydrolase/RimJ/RimL family protein N-acetyltransferase [Paraglaciecola sp.]|jgi:acyl-CoA hydrolase/RimJ/RimL family protein N-acetyltransferase